MSDHVWLVIQCSNCRLCSGHVRQHGRCPHCGQVIDAKSEVLDTADSSLQLAQKVSLANTPEPLRAEIVARTKDVGILTDEDLGVSPRKIFAMLQKNASSDGTLRRVDVENVLKSLDSVETPERIMSQAEVEGLVIALSSDLWMFIA